MPTYLIRGAEAQCPKCGHHRFSGPAELRPQDKVTCVSCGHVCTADEAIEAARCARGFENRDSA